MVKDRPGNAEEGWEKRQVSRPAFSPASSLRTGADHVMFIADQCVLRLVDLSQLGNSQAPF